MHSDYIPSSRDAPEIAQPIITDKCRKQYIAFFQEFIRIYARTVDDLEWYWKDQARERTRLGIERGSRMWWRLRDMFAARKEQITRDQQ